MATDRQAKLTIEAATEGFGQAKDDVASVRKEVQASGEAAEQIASQVDKGAEAYQRFAELQKRAAAEGRNAWVQYLRENAPQATADFGGDQAKAVRDSLGPAYRELAAAAREYEKANRDVAASTQQAAAAGREDAQVTAAVADAYVASSRAAVESWASERDARSQAIEQGRQLLSVEGDLAASSAAATRELAESATAQAAAIRASSDALEVQREKLTTIVSTLAEVTSANVKAGAANTEQANVAGEALLTVKARLAEVNELIGVEVRELRSVEQAARASATATVEALSAQIEAIRASTSGVQVQRQELIGIREQLQQIIADQVEAGDAESAAAESAGQALSQVSSALAEVNAEIKTETQAWGQLRNEAQQTAQVTVEALLQQAESIQQTTQNLEVQKAALSAVQGQLQEMLRDALAVGDDGTSSFEKIGIAITDVRDRLRGVTAAMKEQETVTTESTGAATISLDQLRGKTLTVEEATQVTAAKIRDAWALYNEELKITPRQVGFVVQAHEGLRQTIIETRGTIENATAEERANYELLGRELQKLQQRAQLLQDQASDAKIRLKETGTQIQGVGMAVQQMTSALGPAGETLGRGAGMAAIFAGSLQQIRDQIEQLHLNRLNFNSEKTIASLTAEREAIRETVAVGGLEEEELARMTAREADLTKTIEIGAASRATQVIQIAAVVAALYGSIKAGEALAKQDETNRQSLESFTTSAKNFARNWKENFLDKVGGAQKEFDIIIGDLSSFSERLGRVPLKDSARDLGDLEMQTERLGVAMTHGGTGADIYSQALKLNIDRAHAAALSNEDLSIALGRGRMALVENDKGEKLWQQTAEKSISVHQFYRQAMASGVEGSRIWNEVLRESEGDVKKLEAGIRSHIEALDAQTKAEELLRRAQVENAGQIAETNRQLNEKLRAIQTLIPQSDKFTNTLHALGGELEKLVGTYDGLSREERERARVLIEATKNAELLTEAQRAQALALIASILEGQKATAVVNMLVEAEAKYDTAVRGTTARINDRLTAIAALLPNASDYAGALKDLGDKLRDDAEHTRLLTKEERDRLDIIAQSIADGHQLTDVQKEYIKNLIEAARAGKQASGVENEISRAVSGLDQAYRGTTARINDNLGAIARLIGESARFSPVLLQIGAELKKNADQTYGLTQRERERYEVISELVSRADKLTIGERQLVAAIIQEIQVGKQATESAKGRAQAFTDLQTAIAKLNQTINEQTKSASAVQESAIEQDVRNARKLLESNRQLSSSQRAYYEEVIKSGERIGRLVEQQNLLEKQEKSVKQTTDQLLTSETNLDLAEQHATTTAKRYADTEDEVAKAHEHHASTARTVAKEEVSLTVVHGNNIAQLKEQLKVVQDAIKLGGAQGNDIRGLIREEQQLTEQIAERTKEMEAATGKGHVYTIWKGEDLKATQLQIAEEKRHLEQLNQQVAQTDKVQTSTQALVKIVKDGREVWTNVSDDIKKYGDATASTAQGTDAAASASQKLQISVDGGKIAITNAQPALSAHEQAVRLIKDVYGEGIENVEGFKSMVDRLAESLLPANEGLERMARLIQHIGTASVTASETTRGGSEAEH